MVKGPLISGAVLQENAMSLNKVIAGDFAANLGWLDCWKKHHGVQQIDICDEKFSAVTTQMEWFKDKFLDIVKKESLTLEQI